jgi:DNA anti-recombination protein RmuC
MVTPDRPSGCSVPVTARLSRRFYDAFGEEIANELVDWFNAVDLTYRADLRELNELNFARFDAKLEQRIAQSEARMERRLSELDAKIDRVATELDAKIDRVATELDAKIDRVAAELRADLLKWMFLFWLGTVGPILALLWPIATR